MSEAILGLVIVALLVERYLSNRSHATEIARMNNALIAKTAAEKRSLDQVLPKAPVERRPEPAKVDGYVGQIGLS